MPSEKKTGNCNHMSSQVKHNKSGALVGRKCLEEAPFTWNCIGTEKITSKEEKKERRGRGFVFPGGFPPSLAVKNPPVMQETLVWSLGWEDPLEEGMATHSSILAWRIPLDRGTWWVTVHGVAKSQTQLSDLATKQQPIEGFQWCLLIPYFSELRSLWNQR